MHPWLLKLVGWYIIFRAYKLEILSLICAWTGMLMPYEWLLHLLKRFERFNHWRVEGPDSPFHIHVLGITTDRPNIHNERLIWRYHFLKFGCDDVKSFYPHQRVQVTFRYHHHHYTIVLHTGENKYQIFRHHNETLIPGSEQEVCFDNIVFDLPAIREANVPKPLTY